MTQLSAGVEGLLMMLMLTITRFTKLIYGYSITLPPFLSTRALSQKVKVISTDAEASLPAKDGRAEILNSSLVKYPELTLCARFLTHHFSTHPDGYSSMAIISYGYSTFLHSSVARPCDQYFQADSCIRQS